MPVAINPFRAIPNLYGSLNPKPQTPNPKPQTPNPKPQTPNPKVPRPWRHTGGRTSLGRRHTCTRCIFSLHPPPYTLHPTPYPLHLAPCNLQSTPYTVYVRRRTRCIVLLMITMGLYQEFYIWYHSACWTHPVWYSVEPASDPSPQSARPSSSQVPDPTP